MIALSIVSHRQTALVDDLLSDLIKLPAGIVSVVVLTLNTKSEVSPNLWEAVTPWRKVLIKNAIEKGFGANHNFAFFKVFSPDEYPKPDDVWVVINPDIRLPEAKLLPELLEVLNAGNQLVGPQVLENNEIAASARGLYTPYQALRGFLGLSRNFSEKPTWIAGMFLMVRAETFARLKGFDERYYMYCEDVDLSLRIQNIGGSIAYAPQCKVLHLAQRNSHKSLWPLWLHLRSACRLWLSSAFWTYSYRRYLLRRHLQSGIEDESGR